MKKKNTNTRPNKIPPENDMRSLNSSLGNFGLEPPKRYRNEVSERETAPVVKRPQRKPQRQKSPEEIRREDSVRRKRAKARRKVLFYAGLIIGIAAVIVVLSLTVLFKIDTVTIKGNKIYTNQEISAVLPIEKGSNLFINDTEKAAEKLEQNLPYIYRAEIKRKIPSTVIVNITETPVVYSVGNKDKTFTLLDGDFKVLETAAKKNKAAIQLNKVTLKSAVPGQQAEFTNEKIKENLLLLTAEVQKLKLEKITAVYSADINNNYFVYDGRITVKLGTLDALEDKVYAALAVIDKLAESNPQAEGILNVTNSQRAYFTEK